MAQKRQKDTRTYIPLILFAAGVLFILAAVIWAYQQSVPAGISGAQNSANPNPAAVPLPGIARISLEEARSAYERGEAVFVDVRNAEAYAESHIPGALLIPESELAQRLGELDPEKWVITY